MKIQTTQQINQYLKSYSPELRRMNFPLEKLDLTKIEGIQKDIPVFKDITMHGIKFLSKWFQVLNLARGCRENCTFCLRNAQAPIKEKDNKINTILWDDLTSFTYGISELNNRLNFNILQGNSHVTLFEDANLPVINIKDSKGDSHNLINAIKNIYENLKIPFVLATAGWFINDKKSQSSAEELVKYILNNPEASREFSVSVNPFYSFDREIYTDKIANALKTFLPLYRNGVEKASIILKYNFPNGVEAGKNGYESAKSLYEEIYKKLRIMSGISLDDYEILKPENVTRHSDNNYIENKGRGQKFFAPEDVSIKQKELFVDSFQWLTLPAEEKKIWAYNSMTKNVDINGNIYLITPEEQVINTNMKLNFINKDKETAKIHTDLEYYPLSEI